MAWTSPRTWTTAELVTAAIMNTHVRDNFSYLKDSPTFDGNVTVSRSAAAASVVAQVTNTDNTSTASNARLGLTVGGTSAGSPYVLFTVTGATSWLTGINNSDNDSFYFVPAHAFTPGVLVLDTAGGVYINDNANGLSTIGLTINQGDNDNEILTLKSSDVAHGITSGYETDTYGAMEKVVGADGGLRVKGLTEVTIGLQLFGISTTADTTKTTAGRGSVEVLAGKKSGTSVVGMGANENMLSVRDSGGATRFILDADGDSHQDVGTAWTNFDDHEDADLLTALSVHVSRPGDPIKDNFRQFLRGHRRRLEALGLVTFNRDGHHFVNMSRLTMLLVGAVRQTNDRVERLVAALTAAGLPPALLKGV